MPAIRAWLVEFAGLTPPAEVFAQEAPEAGYVTDPA